MSAGPAAARQGVLTLALAGAFALAGCGQPPGFELSWRIDDAPLEAVKQCSDVGIFAVRVTISSGAEVVAIDEHPCISSVESSVEGPPLEPGEYTIVVEGLRRSGEPWAFDPEVDLERIAYDSESVIVSEGALPRVEAVLLAPPECDDGIDNDRDGTVDGQDPGCVADVLPGAEPSESNDADDTLFQLAVTFLGSPVVKPVNVGVQSLRLEVDGELLAQVSSSQLDYTQSPFRLPLLAKDLEGDNLELEITAIGADGALTETQSFPIESTYVNLVVDFGSEAFVQPIIEPIALTFDPGCSPGGTLELETMRIRVLDENGLPVDAATLGLTGTTTASGSPLSIQPVDDGEWVSFECPSSAVRSNELPWGRYSVEAQARLANVACFESPVTDLAPQPVSAQTIALERVLIDGVAACPECSVDPQDPTESNCAFGLICEGGLCVAEDDP